MNGTVHACENRRAFAPTGAMSGGSFVERAVDAAIDSGPGAAYRRRADGDQFVDDATEGIQELTGRTADGLRGDAGWLGVVHPDDREALRETVSATEPGESVETTYRIERAGRRDAPSEDAGDDADVRWVRDRFALDADGRALHGVLTDVTEERERVQKLEDDAALLDAIFESIPVHMFVKDEDARHVLVSHHYELSQRCVGKTDLELEFVDEDPARNAYEDDLRVIEEGETIIDQEEYLPGHDRWNLTSKVPWENDEGEIVGLIGVTRDITERKRAQQELREKTERLDNFADVVSHDLRNPLNVAGGYVDLAREVDDDDDHLDEAAAAIDRAGEIVDDVLALSRHGEREVDPEPVSLTEIARSAWNNVATEDATVEFPDEDVVLEADHSQLSRVLENLFRNSVEHAGDDVSVAVETLQNGFAVEDDGPGVPADEREQIFRTSYSTREDGTGFGLAIVTEIADAHGWSVSVGESTADGARFEITGLERGEDGDGTS